jgi:hypothetical protein
VAGTPCHPGCAPTYCKRETPVYELRVTKAKGYQFVKIGVGRKRKRRLCAYECLDPDCHYDFRVLADPQLVEDWGLQVTCPLCESMYVEWLNVAEHPFRVTDPGDVYLNTLEEWGLVPPGKIVCKKTVALDSMAREGSS